jgi:cysteinyl-tRNA synthetase
MELREEILEVFYDNTTFGEKADAILALVAEDRVALMRRAKEAEHDSDTFEAAFKQAEARFDDSFLAAEAFNRIDDTVNELGKVNLALEYCGNECKLAMDKAIKAEKERDEWKDHAERFLERAEKAEAREAALVEALVQAREALVRAKANADSWGCHDNIIDAAIAALDERLGRKA